MLTYLFKTYCIILFPAIYYITCARSQWKKYSLSVARSNTFYSFICNQFYTNKHFRFKSKKTSWRSFSISIIKSNYCFRSHALKEGKLWAKQYPCTVEFRLLMSVYLVNHHAQSLIGWIWKFVGSVLP